MAGEGPAVDHINERVKWLLVHLLLAKIIFLPGYAHCFP